MTPAPQTALFLGRFPRLVNTEAFERVAVPARTVALQSRTPRQLEAADALRFRWAERDVEGVPLYAAPHRAHFPANGQSADAWVVQMADGDVFVTDVSEHIPLHADAVETITLKRPDPNAFLARYAQNMLTDGARAHCFCTGTMIYTARGPVAVEDIRVGFPVRTLDYGVQPVRWIGTTLHTQPRAHAPIEIAAGALGKGFPATTLRVSPHHRLCLRSSIAESMFGVPEVLMAAMHLLDVPGVRQIDGEIPVRYWHIATARHTLVCANGTWAETLFPGLPVPAGMDASDVSVLEVAFEQILSRGREEAQKALPPARPILRGAAQRAFVGRHLKQRRAFVVADINPDEDEAQASYG